jgi:malonate-semialdehyde dehydrogenase (acetylating)/methylmalonate-semialdehyde dehydrogenase
MAEQLMHVIGNEKVAAKATAWESVYDPALGTVIGEVPLDDERALEMAVDQADQAFSTWSATPILERTRVMFRYRDLLVRHQAELAELVTREHGKVLADATNEVGRGIEVVELACGAPTILKGELLAEVAHGVDVSMLRVPLGVVAGITPFNFPAMIPLWMIPPAIVSGNTFVLKPSERTPLTSLRLLELLHEAGLPPGVVNIVHGGRAVVDRILTHPKVRAVSFVGSQPVAEHVYRTAAAHDKRVQALGGAKNFHVVMPDADWNRTIEALTSSAYGSAGERCLAGSVAVAVGEAGNRLVELMQARAERLIVGDGRNAQSEMGPLIRAQHRDRVAGYIDRVFRKAQSWCMTDACIPGPNKDSFWVRRCLMGSTAR